MSMMNEMDNLNLRIKRLEDQLKNLYRIVGVEHPDTPAKTEMLLEEDDGVYFIFGAIRKNGKKPTLFLVDDSERPSDNESWVWAKNRKLAATFEDTHNCISALNELGIRNLPHPPKEYRVVKIPFPTK